MITSLNGKDQSWPPKIHSIEFKVIILRAVTVTCSCIFLLDPDKGYCNATVAWHIEKGHYDQTQLDGLNAVAVFVSPGNMFTGPKMKAAFYLDQRADQEQVDALSKIFSGQSGGFFAAAANFIGENVGIKSSQIEFGNQGKRRWLTIPE